MKKLICLFSISILFISACTKDDFCTKNPVTPKLVLRFYDNTSKTTLKSTANLSIIAEGKKDSLYVGQSVDSIAIPLNSLKTETVYTLKINNANGAIINNQIAKFTIKYTPQEKYVSRSCGFKIIFNNVTFLSDNSWIKGFTPQTLTTIDHQNSAHVQIFH